MKFLDLTFPTPAENLACDEALLDWCEELDGGNILRFWEPLEHFVVVGYANKIYSEVNAAACKENQVPILRRCSGGGTVVQGPGCLNYSLILRMDAGGPLAGINSANRFIMERNRAALETVLQRPVEISGHTDLALDGSKFSGNAQRRKRNFLLFHGTFLLRFNLSLIEKILPLPSSQPDYRQNRAHSKFLTNLDSPADAVKLALRDIWQADEPLDTPPGKSILSLARNKYVTEAWNFKF